MAPARFGMARYSSSIHGRSFEVYFILQLGDRDEGSSHSIWTGGHSPAAAGTLLLPDKRALGVELRNPGHEN